MKKLIFVNQKGGSGKSILSYNMAHYLADMGQRVLFIDGDEQANSSKSLAQFTVKNMGASALFNKAEIVLPAQVSNITLLHGDAGLRKVEQSPTEDSELVACLIDRLASIADRFDYAVIDTAGANSRVANALLIVSNFAVLPCRVDPYSIDVATEVIRRINFVQQNFNHGLLNLGILPNEIDACSHCQQQWLEQLIDAYPQFVMSVRVPKRSAYREACDAGVPVWRLRVDPSDGGQGNVKTSARIAGHEVRGAFKIIQNQMEQQ